MELRQLLPDVEERLPEVDSQLRHLVEHEGLRRRQQEEQVLRLVQGQPVHLRAEPLLPRAQPLLGQLPERVREPEARLQEVDDG